MATTSDSRPGRAAALARAFSGAGEALGRIFMPAACLHCGSRRWRGTPLCLACLRKLDRLDPGGCARCGAGRCRDDHAYWPHPFSSARFLYRVTPEFTALAHGFKYRHMRRNVPVLAARLRHRPDLSAHIRGFDALVPVPLHAARQRERGYNQAALIASAFSRIAGVPARDLLRRIRSTGTQTRLGRDERLGNLEGAFACPCPEAAKGMRLLLVDDVFTTGATLSACALALRSAGCADVGVMALGHVEAGAAQDDFVAEMDAVAGYLA